MLKHKYLRKQYYKIVVYFQILGFQHSLLQLQYVQTITKLNNEYFQFFAKFYLLNNN
jgi:hypothetical protein